jgi:O-methyltransferase
MIACLAKIERVGIQGDIVECGVWRAGNIVLARKICPTRTCWLYDTFSGMTEPQMIDGESAIERYKNKTSEGRGWADVSLEEVKAGLAAVGVPDNDLLRFISGPVEQTLLDATNLPERIALLRLDTDWYSSTKIELEVLYPRLVTGGYLIIDDYNHWIGCKTATDEFFKWGGQLDSAVRIDGTAIRMRKGR